MNKKIHNFKDSLKVGDYGENIIYNYLNQSPTVDTILDVSDIKMYQELEVDMITKMTDGQEYKIEIKTDTYQSGNIYYETVSAEEVGSIGGFEKTVCDYMFYYFINMSTLYILKMDEYRKWFRSKEESFIKKGYQKSPVNRRWNGSTYTSIGYAYPISLLEAEGASWCSKVHLDKNNYLN